MKGSVKLPVFIDDARKLVNTTQLRAKYLGATYEAEYCQWQALHGLGSLMETASLIITPNAYLEGKLLASYPPDPIGDFDVTRATTATRVNSAGLVELVPYNLLTWSEDLTQWIANAQIATTQLVFNPLTGQNNATKITKVTSAGDPWVVQTNAAGDGTYTYSFYLWTDAGQPTDVTLFLYNSAVSEVYTLNVTLTTTPTRYEYTSTFASTGGTITARIDLSATATNQYIYAYAGQLVEGSVAKDYQKTETRLNIPRLDYSNGTCPSLLVEPQRTNLALYSEQFDNAYWGVSQATISANVTVAPNGTNTADKLIESNTNALHEVYSNTPFSLTSGIAYTKTIYAKSSERTQIALNFVTGGFGQGSRVIANLTTGTLGTVTNYGGVTGSTATITNVNNGWYRISITMTPVTTATFYADFSPALNGAISYQGDGTSGLFIWGAQLEAGSYATSYIPTTSASVTRNADVISKTGISSLIGQTEGTLFVDFNYDNSTAQGNPLLFSLRNTAWTNEVYAQVLASGGIQVQTYLGGVQQSYLFYSGATNGHHKIAYTYKQNDFALFVDGVLVATDTSGNVPTTDDFCFGYFNTAFTPSANYNATALWKTRLTNTQLAQLTTI